MHEDRRAGVGSGIEQGQALGWPLALEQDIDDHITAFIGRPLQLQAERVPDGAAAAVSCDDPVGVQLVPAVRNFQGENRAVVADLDPSHLGLPSNVDQLGLALRCLKQKMLDVVLLQVNHRRQLLVFVVRHQEVEHFDVAVVTPPAGPGQAGLEEALHGTQALDDLEATARNADRPAPEHTLSSASISTERTP